MSSTAIIIEDKTTKYILSVIDILSRYLHIPPLESKDSYGIAMTTEHRKSFRLTREVSLKAQSSAKK